MWTSLGQTRRRAEGIVVSEFDVRQILVPVVLLLVDDHITSILGHSVVNPLNASVTVGMIGACSKLAHAQQLADIQLVESMNLGFKSKLMRSLLEQSIRTNKICS